MCSIWILHFVHNDKEKVLRMAIKKRQGLHLPLKKFLNQAYAAAVKTVFLAFNLLKKPFMPMRR